MLDYFQTWLAEKLNHWARILTSREHITLAEYQHWLDTNPWISHDGHIERFELSRKLSSARSANDVVHAWRWMEHGQTGEVISPRREMVLKFCIPYAPPGLARHHQIEQILSAFQDEVRISNLVGETNIDGVVRPLGGGWAGRIPFFKMEFVRGHSLDKDMSADIDDREFLRRLAKLAYLSNTISQLHHYHIFHHDIKPQNIMLCEEDGPHNDKLLLLDFGYANARLRDRVSHHGGQLSPVYMAPEQALLSQANLTRAADYFSFGVVAHEYLTGYPLFPQSLQIFIEDDYRITQRYLDHLESGAQNRIDHRKYPEVFDLIRRLTIFDSNTRQELCPSPFDVAYVFQHIAKKGLNQDPNVLFLDQQLDFYKQQQVEFDSRAKTEMALAYVEKVMVDVRKRSGQDI